MRRYCLLSVSLTVFLCFRPEVVRADDNVLGLPTPLDPQRPGAVFLHGGGRVTSESFARFHELAGGKNARIVLVPCAGYRRRNYSSREAFLATLNRRFASWIEQPTSGQTRSFEFLYTDNPADADHEEFLRPLTRATGVWFCGGDQSKLNYRYVGVFPQKTRFQQALREVVARGGVVGGTSAGTAIMPEIVTLDENRQGDNPFRIHAAHGFGLLNRAIVEQHFDGRSGRLERFTDLLRDSQRLDRLGGQSGVGKLMLGLAAEEATALVLRGNSVEVVGRGRGHVFLKSNNDRTVTWHQLKTGEIAQLARAGGEVSLRLHP